MSRWRAAAIHLALTVPVLAALTYLQAVVWYPPPLLGPTGAGRMLALLVCGSLALGPLLTLIAATPGKRHLRFDLTVIGLLQIAVIGFGASVLVNNRPVFLVAAIDRVNLVSAAEIDLDDLAKAVPDFATLGWGAPRLVVATAPADAAERAELLDRTLKDGTDIQVLPRYYASVDARRADLLAHCRPIADLRKHDTGGTQVDSAIAGRADDATCWLPLVHRKAAFSQLLSRENGALIGVLAIDPWQR